MDAAKKAILGHLSHGEKERTDVDEVVNPAVTSETIKPHVHEESTQAIDKEVHKDHYHTTVQPLSQKEVLPEQHTHNLAPQVEKEFHHGDAEQDKARVAADLGQFRDTSTSHQTTQSTGAEAQQVGEHVHHHVHETVQPVLHKETIQPEVVHTTIPIHEKHIAPSEHHGLSTLPMKTMDEFKTLGQTSTSGHTHHEEYEGHPRPYNQAFQPEPAPVDRHPEQHEGVHDPEKTGHFSHHKHGPTTGAGMGTGTGIGSTGTGSLAHGSGHRDHYDEQASRAPMSGSGSGVGAGTHSLEGSGTTTGTGIGSTGIGSTGTGSLAHGSGHRDHYDEQASRAPMGGSGSGVGAGTQSFEGSGTTIGHAGHGGHGTSTAMGSGIGGVGAGAVAADLAKDHHRAGHETDLSSHDNRGTFGGSGTGLAGTALGGRTEGNTVSSAADHASRDLSSRHAENEPRHHEHGLGESGHKHTPTDDHVQHASSQGEDPSLDTKSGKWTGTGEPGSHSAVFGLTPDGKTYDETQHHSTKLRGHNDSQREGGTDTSSRNESAPGIADQLNDPRVAEKGHGGKADYGNSSNKPGAGA